MRQSSNREQQNQGSQGMENPYKNKRSRKLLRVHKLLLMLYQELQLYSKTSQQTQG